MTLTDAVSNAINKRIESLDESFLAACSAYMATLPAEEAAIVDLLREVRRQVVAAVTRRLPPALQVLEICLDHLDVAEQVLATAVRRDLDDLCARSPGATSGRTGDSSSSRSRSRGSTNTTSGKSGSLQPTTKSKKSREKKKSKGTTVATTNHTPAPDVVALEEGPVPPTVTVSTSPVIDIAPLPLSSNDESKKERDFDGCRVPATNLASVVASASQFIQEMEDQEVIVDRTLLAKMCLVREMAWDLDRQYLYDGTYGDLISPLPSMEEGAVPRAPSELFPSSLPRTPLAFLTHLLRIQRASTSTSEDQNQLFTELERVFAADVNPDDVIPADILAQFPSHADPAMAKIQARLRGRSETEASADAAAEATARLIRPGRFLLTRRAVEYGLRKRGEEGQVAAVGRIALEVLRQLTTRVGGGGGGGNKVDIGGERDRKGGGLREQYAEMEYGPSVPPPNDE